MFGTPEESRPIRDRVTLYWVALVLAAAFAVWLAYLGCNLYREVDARLQYQIAALPSVGVLVSNFGAAALAPVLILSAFFLREKTDETDTHFVGVFLNLLAIVLGAAVGWGIAVTLVPFDEADGVIYSKIGAGVTAFLSGFVVSYVHPLVKTQLEARPRAFLVQLGLGVAALLITGLAVTVNRTEYLDFARLERAEQAALEAKEKAEIEAIKGKYAQQHSLLKKQRLDVRVERTEKVLKRLERVTGGSAGADAPASAPRE